MITPAHVVDPVVVASRDRLPGLTVPLLSASSMLVPLARRWVVPVPADEVEKLFRKAPTSQQSLATTFVVSVRLVAVATPLLTLSTVPVCEHPVYDAA